MDSLGYIVAALAGYLLGSIPTGFLVAQAKGIDIRTVGSGNIGATNAFRILGKPAGMLVLLCDICKGALAASLVAGLLFESLIPAHQQSEQARQWLQIIGGFSAILGHNYPCWLKFKGGKGIATSAGVFIALAPNACLVAFVVWIALFALTRYVSVGSLAAAVALPIGAWATGGSALLTGLSALAGALAIYKHKANIQRLLAGTESRVGAKKGAAEPPPKNAEDAKE